MNRTITRLVVAAIFLLATAACGGGEETGSGVEKNADGGEGALRDTTTTTAAPAVATTAAPTTAPPKATTTAPPTTAPEPANVIKILDDGQGSSFVDKPTFQAPTGVRITWQNASSKPRKIASEDGTTFVSPDIPPGGSWAWTVKAAKGVYNYRDTTRPYAVAARIQVY